MMSKTRKVFDKEFKLRVVQMSYESASISALAAKLGLRPELLYRWRGKMSVEESRRFPGHGNKAMTPEEAENAKLRKKQWAGNLSATSRFKDLKSFRS